jgi:hypothetical protein
VACLGYQYVVFDPYTTETRKVRAGFDRDDHARLQSNRRYVGTWSRNPRFLVNVQPQTMTGAMAEGLAQPSLLQNTPSSGIYCHGLDPWANGFDRRLLCVEDSGVEFSGIW